MKENDAVTVPGTHVSAPSVESAAMATPLTPEQLMSIANRYAPVVRFHPDEQYFMCSVDWYLQHSTLHGPNNYVKASPAVSDLPKGEKDDEKYWLEMNAAVKPGDLSTARTYVHATWKPGNNYTDIQYWFCYGYNGPGTLHVANFIDSADINVAPLGEHWVDWEQVTVRIKNDTQQVLGLYLSQHGEGEWLDDVTKLERKNDQFVVYASKNGHAVYAQPGTHPTESHNYEVFKFYLCNYTAGGGKFFDSAGKLEIVSVDFIPGFTEPNWVHFPYRWGKGTNTKITPAVVEQIIAVACKPFGWLLPFFDLIKTIAGVIASKYAGDDTNGVYGPKTQGYWHDSQIPPFFISNGYTGSNTNYYSPPSIVSFKKDYHIFFMDHYGKGVMHVISSNGIDWSRPTHFHTGEKTSSGPCGVVYKNTLTVFFRDSSGNGILHIQSTDGDKFKRPPNWYIGINCDHQPAAAVLNHTLCVVGKDAGGNGIMRAVQTSENGPWNTRYTGFNASAPPAIVAFKDHFHIFYRDKDGDGIMHITSRDGISWSMAHTPYIGFNTSAGPAAIVFEDTLYVFFRDVNGDGILYLHSKDGNKFKPVPNWYFKMNCRHEPSVAHNAHTKTMCLACIDADGNGIMRSVFYKW